jgi:hypothetical protein
MPRLARRLRDSVRVVSRRLVAVVTGAFGVPIVVGLWANDWDWLNWDAAVGAATAYGTLALALVTWELAKSSNEDVRATGQLAQLAEREQQALLRPFVRPWLNPDWGMSGNTLPLRNDGAGVALNVDLHIQNSEGDRVFAATSLAPGEQAILATSNSPLPNWSEVWGYVRYDDLLGQRWETRFTTAYNTNTRLLEMRVCVYGLAEHLPQLAYPKGWELENGLTRVVLS